MRLFQFFLSGLGQIGEIGVTGHHEKTIAAGRFPRRIPFQRPTRPKLSFGAPSRWGFGQRISRFLAEMGDDSLSDEAITVIMVEGLFLVNKVGGICFSCCLPAVKPWKLDCPGHRCFGRVLSCTLARSAPVSLSRVLELSQFGNPNPSKSPG